MKSKQYRIRTMVGLALLVSALVACGNDSPDTTTVEVSREKSLGMTWEEYRERARQPTQVEGRTIFAVDWDVFTDSEEFLRAYYDALYRKETEKLALFKRLSNGFEPVFGPDAAVSLRYCVSDQFQNFPPNNKPLVVTHIQAAMQAWQDVVNVNFVYIPAQDGNCTDSNTNVDFAVIPSTWSQYSGCATNKLIWAPLGCPVTGPFSNSAARGVLAMNYPKVTAPDTPTGTMKHELGHMLGFRHEHVWGNGGAGGCTSETATDSFVDLGFRRLTNYDQASVMHYPGICGKPNVDFAISALDGEGARQVYGIPAAWHVFIY
jgi:serralysin